MDYRQLLKVFAIACFISGICPFSAIAKTTQSVKINVYPEVITESLLNTCENQEASIQLLLPLDRKPGKPASVIISQKIRRIDEQAKNSEEQVEQQVQQRQEELAELLQDKKEFQEQLKQLEAAIQNKQVPESQLPQIQKLRDDLAEIQSDPHKLKQQAAKSRQELLSEIRKQQVKQTNKLKQCVCQVETIQQKYTVEALYQGAIAEMTTSDRSISQAWMNAAKTCQDPK